MAPTLKICSFVSQTSKMDFWFACFQLFLKDNGTFMVYIMFSRGLAKWLDRMNPKDISRQAEGNSRNLRRFGYFYTWEGTASQSQKKNR